MQQAAAVRAAEQARTWRAIGIFVIVLVVVGGFVWLSQSLGEDATATSTSSALPDCTPPPPVPGTAARLELPDPATARGKTFEAVVTTNCGDIVMTLDGAVAPQAVASFVALAGADYWKDSPCHRLMTSGNVVLQCGDPTGTGTGGPGYGFGVENPATDDQYVRGTVAMARTGDIERGAGGQFFIVAQDSRWSIAQGGYSRFGTVTAGLDIVDRIVAAGVAGGDSVGAPAAPISILRVAVSEKKA